MSQQDQRSSELKDRIRGGVAIDLTTRTEGWQLISDGFDGLMAEFENVRNSNVNMETAKAIVAALDRVRSLWIDPVKDGREAQSELDTPPEEY